MKRVNPHTINACWFLFLLFAYLLVAEAASFDKKELCRSDTSRHFFPHYSTTRLASLKVPKREIFDRSDFPDFYTIKSSWAGDLVVKILTYNFN
jgi:hypothetical protein